MNDTYGVYIHIPFCLKKCNYCDFCSFCDFSLTEKYVDALILHIKSAKKAKVNTVYIGGGTPTVLKPEQLISIINAVKSTFELSVDTEFTIECNPKTADFEYFKKLKDAGVNRLSLGLQSAVDYELSTLGRLHSAEDAKDAVLSARKAGFENVSLDLMYGLPNQTLDSFSHSIDFALSLSPEHISSYALKIEEGTPFSKMNLDLPNEDTVCDMLSLVCDKLSANGYKRYEISNFAKKGFESRHNLKYWHTESYISFGVSASSYIEQKRYTYTENIEKYIDFVHGKIPFSSAVAEEYTVDKKDAENEFLMLSLRLTNGFSKSEFKKKFGISFDEKYGAKFDKYVRLGLGENNNDMVKLTDGGLIVSNTILSEIIDF